MLSRVTDEVGKLPREVWPIVAAHWSRPGYYAGMRRHVEAVPDTVREMEHADPIRGIPVLVLTPGKSTPLQDRPPSPYRRQRAANHRTRQCALDSSRPARSGDRFHSRNGDGSGPRCSLCMSP